jgi:cell volume regulation protein A
MNPADLNLALLATALTLLVAVAAVRLATKAGLPSLLLYIAIGLIIGEAGLGLRFDDADLAMVLGSIALAIILAEGGLTTQWPVIRPVLKPAATLATAGVAVSIAVTASIIYLVLDVDLRIAILLGAVVSSTDAAAVFSVLRQLPLQKRPRATLEAESGFNDPPVIILVTIVASTAWDDASGLRIGGLILYQLLAGALLGLLVARAGQWVLIRSALPSPGLYPVATVAIVLLAFAVAGLAGASPFLAVYVAGLWLGNVRLPHRNATRGFVEGLAWLAQIGLFVMLGLLASPSRLPGAFLTAVIVGGALLLLARPLSVLVCATPFRIPWREQAFMSWAGLRGAVPIVLATIPITVGLPAADRIFDVVFLLVIVFTLIQGPTLPAAARWLGVVDTGTAREVSVDAAPLERIDATILHFTIPEGSRLAGLYPSELRLPGDAAITLIQRDGRLFVPEQHSVLRAHDQLLLATPNSERGATERRLDSLSRLGRLAGWRSGLTTRDHGIPGTERRRATGGQSFTGEERTARTTGDGGATHQPDGLVDARPQHPDDHGQGQSEIRGDQAPTSLQPRSWSGA